MKIAVVLGLLVAGCATGPRVEWLDDETEAFALAKDSKKLVVVDYTANWCVNCKDVEKKVFRDARVVNRLKRYVTFQIDATRTQKHEQAFMDRYQVNAFPWVSIVHSSGRLVRHVSRESLDSPEAFLRALNGAVE